MEARSPTGRGASAGARRGPVDDLDAVDEGGARQALSPGAGPAAVRREMVGGRRLGLRMPAGGWFPVALFAVVAVALFVVTRVSVAWLPFAPVPGHQFPDLRWFEGWTRWDTGWYWYIAEAGYNYHGAGQQAHVAFFPAYPLAMRVLGAPIGDVLVAGVVVTFASGLAAAVLFHRWCADAFGPRVARLGLVLLLLYPFAYYLFGVVYSDALFLAAAIAAFVLLERDRPWLAGLAGAVATAARPVGVALVIGLVVRALEVRGVVGWGPARLVGERLDRARLAGARAGAWARRARAGAGGTGAGAEAGAGAGLRSVRLGALRWRDAGVLLSAGGLAAFCAYLWWRFDEPFAFNKVANAPGWSREISMHTLLKGDFFTLFEHPDLSAVHAGLGLQALVTVLALALVPAIVRRLGWGYGLYVLFVVSIPAAASKDFIGMGRYVLVAFPAFAVAADLLAHRRRLVWLAGGVAAASATGLVVMASLFARWYFLS